MDSTHSSRFVHIGDELSRIRSELPFSEKITSCGHHQFRKTHEMFVIFPECQSPNSKMKISAKDELLQIVNLSKRSRSFGNLRFNYSDNALRIIKETLERENETHKIRTYFTNFHWKGIVSSFLKVPKIAIIQKFRKKNNDPTRVLDIMFLETNSSNLQKPSKTR